MTDCQCAIQRSLAGRAVLPGGYRNLVRADGHGHLGALPALDQQRPPRDLRVLVCVDDPVSQSGGRQDQHGNQKDRGSERLPELRIGLAHADGKLGGLDKLRCRDVSVPVLVVGLAQNACDRIGKDCQIIKKV